MQVLNFVNTEHMSVQFHCKVSSFKGTNFANLLSQQLSSNTLIK